MPSLPFRRLLLTGLPTLVAVCLVGASVWGDHGLLRRHELKQELHTATARLARVERDNQRLLRELSLMERDPVVLERVAADELRWAREGTILFRFDD